MDTGTNRVAALKKRFQELKDELEEKDDTCHKLTKELTEKNDQIKRVSLFLGIKGIHFA